jgi:hypothetical protein
MATLRLTAGSGRASRSRPVLSTPMTNAKREVAYSSMEPVKQWARAKTRSAADTVLLVVFAVLLETHALWHSPLQLLVAVLMLQD